MNQHIWVKICLARYEEQGLTPEPGGEWQRAHYPAPKGVGESTVWLMQGDHQVQGVLQSEEYGRMCFYPYDAKKFLTEGPLVPGWFELWDLYEKWKKKNTSDIGKKAVKIMNKHPNTLKNQKEQGRVNGKANARAMNSHPETKRARMRTAKKIAEKTSRPVVCVETGCVYPSSMEAARKSGVPQGNISRSCRKGCRAGGYFWKFTG